MIQCFVSEWQKYVSFLDVLLWSVWCLILTTQVFKSVPTKEIFDLIKGAVDVPQAGEVYRTASSDCVQMEEIQACSQLSFPGVFNQQRSLLSVLLSVRSQTRLTPKELKAPLGVHVFTIRRTLNNNSVHFRKEKEASVFLNHSQRLLACPYDLLCTKYHLCFK